MSSSVTLLTNAMEPLKLATFHLLKFAIIINNSKFGLVLFPTLTFREKEKTLSQENDDLLLTNSDVQLLFLPSEKPATSC